VKIFRFPEASAFFFAKFFPRIARRPPDNFVDFLRVCPKTFRLFAPIGGERPSANEIFLW